MEQNPAEVITQLPTMTPRSPESNKGDFGRVLVVAGSRGMSGAAILCAGSALRGGAGLVTLAIPHELAPVAAGANPCYLTLPLPQDQEGRVSGEAVAKILPLVEINDVTALGPGLGRSQGVAELVLAVIANANKVVVLDADGLNALQPHLPSLVSHRSPLILTPHPGEFARLTGKDIATVQSGRQELSVAFAAEHKVILVLKGHNTLVTDGRRIFLNRTGNPGMATGGTGDVLTGLIAALVGQGLEPFAAAQLGVHLHGLAGDLARDDVGEIPLIASDLLDYLPKAFRYF